MGEVVPLHPQSVSAVWRAWVACLCWLAGQPERADDFLARGFTRARIVRDLRIGAPGLRQGEYAATYLAEMRGPAGAARRSRPIHPQPHGTRRRPMKDTPA